MIIILAYWLFLFLLFLPGGLFLNRILGLKTNNACLLELLGILFFCTWFTVTAFIFPLGLGSFLFWLLISLLFGVIYNKELITTLKQCYNDLIKLPFFYKTILLLLFAGTLVKSALAPSLPDNESYYLQTIKWLNEYGLVKGLGNLHLFLAQTSAWHILQAGLNFSFLTNRINDINGFVFVLCCFYCFQEVSENKSLTQKSWIGIVPALSGIFFFFLDTTSPDLPLLIITPVIFWLYTQKTEISNTSIAALLFVLLVFIKITIAPLGLIFIPFLCKRKNFSLLLTALGVSLIWVFKNFTVSGYLFYPFIQLGSTADWVIPYKLLDGINASSNSHIYYTAKNATLMQKILHWFSAPGLIGIVNKSILLLLLIIPFSKTIRKNKKYLFIYAAFIIQFLLLLVLSPQIRFFLPAVLFFSTIIVADITIPLNNYGVNSKILLGFGTLLSIITIVVPTFFTVSRQNFMPKQHFSVSQLWLPEPNTALKAMEFKKCEAGNLEYYSPAENFFFYGTANGNLPCVNEVQLNRFKDRFGVIPQLRTMGNLKDGFYSAPVQTKE